MPRDEESVKIWKSIFEEQNIESGVAEIGNIENGNKRGIKKGERIFYYDDKNWWSRCGCPHSMPVGEVGGGDTEIFYDFSEDGENRDRDDHPNSDKGDFVEIGNIVFTEYEKGEGDGFKKLEKRTVDFGGGLERLTSASNGKRDIFFM